jgi:hypothetical protein
MMTPGKWYIVTKASDDGTFGAGDRVRVDFDGAVTCLEAQGWIRADAAKVAMQGMQVEIDTEWVERRKAKLLAELATL